MKLLDHQTGWRKNRPDHQHLARFTYLDQIALVARTHPNSPCRFSSASGLPARLADVFQA